MFERVNAFDISFEPRSSLICNDENDDDKGKGGGDGGDGGDGKDGDKGKEGLDDETKKFIANTVNASVSSFMKRDGFKNAVGDAVKASVGDAVKEAIASALPKDDDDGGKGKKPDPRDAELAKMRAEQEKLKKQMEANAAEAEAEKTKGRQQKERSKLTEALRKGGVDEARVAAAVAYIYLDQKLVVRDDKDAICMKFEREWGEELVPIEKGAAEYLKTDAGKVFLPPVDAGGSGNKGGKPAVRKSGDKPTRTELLTHLGNQMLGGGEVPGR